MHDFNNLLITIRKIALEAVNASKPTAVVYGKVISTSPLKIQVEQKMTLTAAQLVLTRNVTNYTTKISFNNPAIKNIVKNYSMDDIPGSNYKLTYQENVKNEITIYNGLVVGDEVVMIQMQGGQKYIVIDRVIT
ncbi:DUF2577 domain-containing protein [Tepidibacter hydrothermalis]|uniref:DUF2577 domain-containing protein n=1 Tax=Tepidibacter hydrothermalis TaxID=3036126 RepID=A0ABY8EGY2_9FIRM|nr:DUF2577 domain-containing protein [Tepidibacter hydrothermalis]WFD12203.1 DUF2577 domain-containing protein [Tepidibacter hydrothermalis]